jgi:hypothetical protein
MGTGSSGADAFAAVVWRLAIKQTVLWVLAVLGVLMLAIKQI